MAAGAEHAGGLDGECAGRGTTSNMAIAPAADGSISAFATIRLTGFWISQAISESSIGVASTTPVQNSEYHTNRGKV